MAAHGCGCNALAGLVVRRVAAVAPRTPALTVPAVSGTAPTSSRRHGFIRGSSTDKRSRTIRKTKPAPYQYNIPGGADSCRRTVTESLAAPSQTGAGECAPAWSVLPSGLGRPDEPGGTRHACAAHGGMASPLRRRRAEWRFRPGPYPPLSGPGHPRTSHSSICPGRTCVAHETFTHTTPTREGNPTVDGDRDGHELHHRGRNARTDDHERQHRLLVRPRHRRLLRCRRHPRSTAGAGVGQIVCGRGGACPARMWRGRHGPGPGCSGPPPAAR